MATKTDRMPIQSPKKRIMKRPETVPKLDLQLDKQLITSVPEHKRQKSLNDGDDESLADTEDEDIPETTSWLFIRNLPKQIQTQRPYVLPKKTRSSPKITLVLDLDETLVHCHTNPSEKSDLMFNVLFNGQEYNVSGNLRPSCLEFLQKCASKYEVVLFTASQKIYANQLANLIDPYHNWFKYRLFRDSCTFISGNYVKDLSVLGRDLATTVIVDNSPQAFGYHLSNGVPIKSWYSDREDTELLKVLDLLEELENADDVRSDLKDIANQICVDNHIPPTKQPKILEFLNKLVQKITPNYSKYTLFKTLKTHVMPLTNCVFDKSGGRFLTGSYDRTAKLWETSTGKELLSLVGHQNVVYALAFNNPFSDKIATGSFDKTVRLWDAESGRNIYAFTGHLGEVVSVNFNPQSNIILSASMDSSAILWDVRSGLEIRKLQGHTAEVISGLFSNDGGLVATGSFDSTVNIWDMRNHGILHTLIGHRGEISNVSFNFTGNRLVSGSIDGTAKIWDVVSGRCLHTIIGHTDQVLDVAFSLNEKKIATASADGTAYIVNANTFEILHELKGHSDEISRVSFNSQASTCITASQDKTVRLWNVNTGECIQVLNNHNDEVFSCAFNYDGDTIVAGSKDNSVSIWKQ